MGGGGGGGIGGMVKLTLFGFNPINQNSFKGNKSGKDSKHLSLTQTYMCQG